MQLNPRHPGANHLYIHAVEASPNPEKGIAAADRLRTLVPDSSHLLHMPSHIDVRLGQWAKAAAVNELAAAADARYAARQPQLGFYRLYMAHNVHFIVFTAMMEGRREVALENALKYDEPPPWTTPSRHALGAVLLETKRPADAEAVYRADLKRYPLNGWSLWGLERALEAQGRDADAAAVKAQFDATWSRADTKMVSSCLCVKPGRS